MGERIAVGDKLPFFVYDTPYSAQNRFRDLLQRKSPLVLVFMANFGHPITRTFASRYANTYGSLRDGGFALVVRSRADKLSRSIGPNTLPYPLLCDAEGVLYEHLDIPQSSSALMTYSLEGWRILREAKRQGYQAAKGQMQQLPLTLILDKDGTVLFCHYGASLTDVPTDCEAMQSLLEELELVPDMPELEDLDYKNFPELEDADELDEEFDTFHCVDSAKQQRAAAVRLFFVYAFIAAARLWRRAQRRRPSAGCATRPALADPWERPRGGSACRFPPVFCRLDGKPVPRAGQRAAR